MSRRVSGAVVCAVVVAWSVSACSGGSDEPKDADRAKAGATPSAVQDHGEPAYPDAGAAFAAISDYNTRNNALIPAANKPPYAKDAFASVDSGPTLAQDRWHALLVKADPAARGSSGWFYDQPLKTYLPAAKTWPKLVLSAGYSHLDGKKSPKPTRWTNLSVFVQPAQGAPLKLDTSMSVLRNKLPTPLGADADADPTVVDRDRAVSLARALAKHWTKDTETVPGFASTKILDATLDEARAEPRPYSDARWTARLLGGPASVRTVAVEGGTLVVADYKVTKDVWAVGTGSYVFWTDNAAKVYGGDRRKSLHSTSYAGAAWFMPSDGGPAVALGHTSGSALFGRAAQ